MTNSSIKRILTIKTRLRTVCRSELAAANRQVESAEQRADRAALERRQAIGAVTRIGEIPARDLVGHSTMVALATQAEQGARRELDAHIEKQQHRSAELREADREVRIFDLLHQKARQRDIREQQANEQKASDEAAARNRGKYER